MNAVIETDRVSKSFGSHRAVDAVTVAIDAGETLIIIGESGCGKTTLLRLFNRLIEPTDGQIRVHGRPLTEHDPITLRRSTGYVQQAGGLLPHWTVGANVALVPRLLGWERGRRDARSRELLTMVGLDPDEHSERYPAELSGGQQQRVAFARALAADPDVILLDEPFGALDAITRHELQDEFLDLKTRLDKTMVLVTHDLDEAFRLGDRIAVMHSGRILQCATPADLQETPADPYVERLLTHRRTGGRA